MHRICGRSSSGRAPPCQGGGSEFEPRRPLQQEWNFTPNMVTWPSGKARVCKTLIHQFKSGRHLQKIPGSFGFRDFLFFGFASRFFTFRRFGNTFSQSLAALPAPSMREPLAVRKSFRFCQGLSLWESWRKAPERACSSAKHL